MKAITLHGPGDVRVESVADPRIVDPTDVVLRITTSAVCGSDLHQYHGRVAGLDPGVVMGHEFMGVVEEVGPAVRLIRKGDRVLAPFSISCGACERCRVRLPTQCTTIGRAVFGLALSKEARALFPVRCTRQHSLLL
jgi:threonine dehydrogenase-like Zn-dependent dehydrogenase